MLHRRSVPAMCVGLLAAGFAAAPGARDVLAAQGPGKGAVDGPGAGARRLVAVSPPQNDLDPDHPPKGKVSPLPAPLEGRIRGLVDRAFRRWRDCQECGVRPSDFYGPILRIRTPSTRDLYVFCLRQPFGADVYYFFLYDPSTRAATDQPASIYGKWMQGEWGARLEKPIIAFRDLDGDGREELVIQERVHNGTMYNAIVYHYFRIAADLSLHRILALETRLLDLATEPEGGVILRSVERVAADELRLAVVLKREKGDAPMEPLGEVTLRRAVPGGPYQVATRRVVNERYRGLLVSGSGEPQEDVFLREGYRFHY